MRKAFTLVELLVVIGIIGILSAVLLGTFSGSTESARAARCLTNMRNLAGAAQTYAMANSYYPPAGSAELASLDSSSKRRKYRYSLIRGWICWNVSGAYVSGGKSDSMIGSSGWNISTYEPADIARDNAITNGALWKYVSGNRNVYVCPTHVQQKKKMNPLWSYVMNGYFGWTAQPGRQSITKIWEYQQRYSGFPRSDRYLLFAELPFSTKLHTGGSGALAVSETTSPGTACDCVLQYRGMSGADEAEIIGFNHENGKQMYGHVAFADGHCEKLVYPKGGMSMADAQELTEWLCTGTDVSFSGARYDKLTATENE